MHFCQNYALFFDLDSLITIKHSTAERWHPHVVLLLFRKAGRCYQGYLYFSLKYQNLFHRLDTTGNIFTSGTATHENITDGVHEMK